MRFFDGVTDRQQAVVPEDRGFVVAERYGRSASLLEVQDDAVCSRRHGVVLVRKRTVLGDRIEGPPSDDHDLPKTECRVRRPRRRSRRHDLRVDQNAACIDRQSPSTDLAKVIDQ